MSARSVHEELVSCPVTLQACKRRECNAGCAYIGDWPPPTEEASRG